MMYSYPMYCGMINRVEPKPLTWIVNDLSYAVLITLPQRDGAPEVKLVGPNKLIRGIADPNTSFTITTTAGNHLCTITPKPGAHTISSLCVFEAS